MPDRTFYGPCDHPALPSFPTRRSSDLAGNAVEHVQRRLGSELHKVGLAIRPRPLGWGLRKDGQSEDNERHKRSEEHTSELQSPCNHVCRLLIENKKRNTVKMHESTQEN